MRSDVFISVFNGEQREPNSVLDLLTLFGDNSHHSLRYPDEVYPEIPIVYHTLFRSKYSNNVLCKKGDFVFSHSAFLSDSEATFSDRSILATIESMKDVVKDFSLIKIQPLVMMSDFSKYFVVVTDVVHFLSVLVFDEGAIPIFPLAEGCSFLQIPEVLATMNSRVFSIFREEGNNVLPIVKERNFDKEG